MDGSDPAPDAGSVIMKHERISRRRAGAATLPSGAARRLFAEVHVGLVRSEAVEPAERRISGCLEDDRLCPVIGPEAAPLAADMRAEQARPAPEPDEFAPQFLGRPVRRLPRVVLIGQDLLAHEALGALLQLGEIVGK